jgi:Arc/MetJ family transcription regulator
MGQYVIVRPSTLYLEISIMRTKIEIDDALLADAQKISGYATKQRTVEEALGLMIRLYSGRGGSGLRSGNTVGAAILPAAVKTAEPGYRPTTKKRPGKTGAPTHNSRLA